MRLKICELLLHRFGLREDIHSISPCSILTYSIKVVLNSSVNDAALA
jgi:hypothetical protein